jgi:hypothetical protein
VDGEVRKQSECATIILCDDIEPDKVTAYAEKKVAL